MMKMGKGGNKTTKWGKGETRGQNREGGNKTTTKILPKAVPRAAADSVRQLKIYLQKNSLGDWSINCAHKEN